MSERTAQDADTAQPPHQTFANRCMTTVAGICAAVVMCAVEVWRRVWR